MRYIDADKLIAEINRRMGEYDVQQITSEHPDYEQGAQDALYNLKLQLTSLQQEQPEVDAIDIGRIFNRVLERQVAYSDTTACFPEVAEWFNARKK